MIALILAHPHIFWLSLGGLLLAAEMLGGNGSLVKRAHLSRRFNCQEELRFLMLFFIRGLAVVALAA